MVIFGMCGIYIKQVVYSLMFMIKCMKICNTSGIWYLRFWFWEDFQSQLDRGMRYWWYAVLVVCGIGGMRYYLRMKLDLNC